MASSLLPEKPLVISPSLAATIGLEEAVLLAVLHELFLHRAQGGWLKVDSAALQAFLPFWQAQDVQRVASSLSATGILHLRSAPYLSSGVLDFNLGDDAVIAPAPPKPAVKAVDVPGRTALIAANWQPDTETLRQLGQFGITQTFVQQQVPRFVSYYRKEGKAHHAWDHRFINWVLRDWRKYEQDEAKRSKETTITRDWKPSLDVMEIFERDGVSQEFIYGCVPEFILFYRDRGDVSSTWNSKFTTHVRNQWHILTAKLANDPTPRPITANWQPSLDVYDILQMAAIDETFARAQISEFVLYWVDSKQVHNSWNSKFLHHVKYRWARRHQQPWQGETDGFIATHTDRSWADGL